MAKLEELPKTYNPQQAEARIYKLWEKSGFFNPDNLPKAFKEPFSIILPPPNVTGTLHMGHAAMLAFEDVLIRWQRMKGFRTLWLPGTDHAAIATQSKVENMLYKEKKPTRHDLGRTEFLKLVGEFAQESHDTIVNQIRRMGSSLDWSREAFTLDEKRNLAVNTAFQRMYEGGLIYRGDRIVNWDPRMQTTVSDDEIEWKEEKTPFYYLRYGPFTIGTARPETKFGDKYVVMHPKDKRYAQYKHGDIIPLEWINGKITATVIKDEAVDMEFGSGVMTITPFHDRTDFEIAERHHLEKERIIDLKGKLLPIAGEFAGTYITKARPQIIEKLRNKDLLERVDENYVHRLATNSRGGNVIEPQIMRQWFVAVNKEFPFPHAGLKGIEKGQKTTIKRLMLHVVKTKQVEILPKRFEKVYFHWVNNLRDWCISRQIWYGHRIPVWYRGEKLSCGAQQPKGKGWEQDPDTLDTWFSSGLWTLSTLGWPKETKDLKTFHPTSVLETGYDILFFWVARMILMTTYLLGEVPFKTVYLHGLVRDSQGRKMSKSLGNVINPLDMVNAYGADATR
ncbi:MAG: valine--tRNA ligase, partial [Patescibacteria group bacterium]